jgi:hypothetical protein
VGHVDVGRGDAGDVRLARQYDGSAYQAMETSGITGGRLCVK